MYDITHWHRTLCPVTDQIIVSGDLSDDPGVAAEQIDQWERIGVTHVIDTRAEWNDEELVADRSPRIEYGWIPTDDQGRAQPDEWFDAGVEFATQAMFEPDAVVLVHCHMGINRGPSMAYRIMLELGWDPIEALDAIRNARPIADIAYASDALDHFHRRGDVPPDLRGRDRDRLEVWKRGYSPTGLNLTRPVDYEPGPERQMDDPDAD
jgi:protein-tyrosine phosphatase